MGSKDLEGTLNLSRTLPGTAVSTGSQVMSNCDRGLSCVRITCRVQQTRARSSAAATTKKTQTRAEANILKTRHSESAMPKQACANFSRQLCMVKQCKPCAGLQRQSGIVPTLACDSMSFAVYTDHSQISKNKCWPGFSSAVAHESANPVTSNVG